MVSKGSKSSLLDVNVIKFFGIYYIICNKDFV